MNYCYIHNAILERKKTRPIFSVFTSCYNSYKKINRAYKGMKEQILKDWEWVILDDSPDDEHFKFLRELAKNDKRIRLYKRDCNSGCIGNVKNETIGLCRGKYILELDHDDIVLPDVLKDAAQVFENNPDVGFIYMDFVNLYEDGSNFSYGNSTCGGYGGYYKQKYNNKWVDVYITPHINNVTLSHLVCCPNHPRIWRRETMIKLENYSEFLPICDDYEILLRTALNTKIVKIHKCGYIQIMNNNNSNFSLIRNKEINRIGPEFLRPQFFKMYDVNNKMKQLDSYEDEKYVYQFSDIWTRKDYTHKFCNEVINLDYNKQYCLLGIETLYNKKVSELYKDIKNDIILLDNKFPVEFLIQELERKSYTRIKCYSIIGNTYEELEKYFILLCKHNTNYYIIKNKIYDQRYDIINHYKAEKNTYLEIGIEYGYTFNNIQISNKIGVDPDPKMNLNNIVKMTSDDFFATNKQTFDIIFIDGMHQIEYVLRDFNNSINCLNDKGIIFLDDVLPVNEREQHKVPIKHAYENGILKYREPWTGDVWKFLYYLLKSYSDKINFEFFVSQNYRGVAKLTLKDEILKDEILKNEIIISPDKLAEIEKYTYKNNFQDYYNILMNNSINN